MTTNPICDNSVDLIRMLYKIVIQFGQYTQNSNKNLDTYIRSITELLKKVTILIN